MRQSRETVDVAATALMMPNTSSSKTLPSEIWDETVQGQDDRCCCYDAKYAEYVGVQGFPDTNLS